MPIMGYCFFYKLLGPLLCFIYLFIHLLLLLLLLLLLMVCISFCLEDGNLFANFEYRL